jgi:hypothetical protein
MKKEFIILVIFIALALILLMPSVIATSAQVVIEGTGSNTGGIINTTDDLDKDGTADFNCKIDDRGRKSGNCEKWYSAQRFAPSKTAYLNLTAYPDNDKEWKSTTITWTIKFRGDAPVKPFADPDCQNEHSCYIEIILGTFGDYYTITAKFTKIENNPPRVNASLDQTTDVTKTVSLSGTSITDDGKPVPPGSMTATWSWSRAGGPDGAVVTFGNGETQKTGLKSPTNFDTTARFTRDGTYTLELSANDGSLIGKDTVVITVNPICGDNVIQSPNENGVNEECDGTAKGLCAIPPESCTAQCTCTQNYCVGECTYIKSEIRTCKSDGTQEVILKTGDKCPKKEECPSTRTVIVPCEKRVVSLPFFSFVQFISSVLVTITIYLIIIINKKK